MLRWLLLAASFVAFGAVLAADPHLMAGAVSPPAAQAPDRCPYPVDGGCAEAPPGRGAATGPFYQDANLIENARQSGQRPYYAAHAGADWNAPGVDYGVGVPPGVTLQDPASARYKGCVYSPTGAPASNGPVIACSGANPTIDAIDQTQHEGVFIRFDNASGTCTIKRSKLGTGSNGVTFGSSMIYISANGNTCNVVFDSDFVDLRYPALNYRADFVQNNATGALTVNRVAVLNAAGRFLEQNAAPPSLAVTNVVIKDYTQTTCCGHGEFIVIDVNGSPAIGPQTYSNVTIVEGAATPQNAVTAPIYFVSGTGTPTYGPVAADHVLSIHNYNRAGRSLPTAESPLASVPNGTRATFTDIRLDPTGTLFCAAPPNIAGTTTTFTDVVDILDGAKVNSYGACTGSHP